MDWIAVGAIAELIGAIAVVLTLFYLADQVPNNTRMARRAATSEAVTAIREATTFFGNDSSMNELFRRGIMNLGAFVGGRTRSIPHVEFKYHQGVRTVTLSLGNRCHGSRFMVWLGVANDTLSYQPWYSRVVCS